MRPNSFIQTILGAWFMLLLLLASPAIANPGDFKPRFDPQPGARVPLDDQFVDETGKSVTLRDYMGRSPVILALVYFGCSNFCTLVLSGLGAGTQGLSQAHEVVAVSISPQDNPLVGTLKKQSFLAHYPDARQWHFLSGSLEAIKNLTQAVGYRYAYEPARHEYAHPAGLVVLTPTGQVARYLLGITFKPSTLHESLQAAADNRTVLATVGFDLGCFSHEALQGPYAGVVGWGIKIVSSTIALLLGLKLWLLFRAEAHRQREESP
jgi:protein SCO1/2